MKSFTIKSLLENVSKEKVGTPGKIDLPPLGALAMATL
jgi:hypothetical protein